MDGFWKEILRRQYAAAIDMLENAIRANVETGVERLKSLEPILQGRIQRGELKVVGAVYDLRTGQVQVL